MTPTINIRGTHNQLEQIKEVLIEQLNNCLDSGKVQFVLVEQIDTETRNFELGLFISDLNSEPKVTILCDYQASLQILLSTSNFHLVDKDLYSMENYVCYYTVTYYA